jgi:hypothetical protein
MICWLASLTTDTALCLTDGVGPGKGLLQDAITGVNQCLNDKSEGGDHSQAP